MWLWDYSPECLVCAEAYPGKRLGRVKPSRRGICANSSYRSTPMDKFGAEIVDCVVDEKERLVDVAVESKEGMLSKHVGTLAKARK